MKRMLKSGFTLLLVLVLVMSLSTTALAADASITFNGLEEGFDFQPGSEYTLTDLFDNFKDVMPGDEKTQKITFTNKAEDCDYIKLYMKAIVHDEEGNVLTYSEPYEFTDGKDQAGIEGQRNETVVTMADFLAQLSMEVYNGETLIYQASPDELDGLAEPVLLGEFRNGQTTELNVKLQVPIELGKEYANRVGEVDWVFTAEGFDDPECPEIEPCDWLTVHKIWKGCGPHPDSVKVRLLRDGKPVSFVYLTPLTQWTWTWAGLDDDHEWTVEEVVPEGYVAKYYTIGNLTVITNTQIVKPTEPPTEPTVPPTEPSEPTEPTIKPTEPTEPTVPPTEPSEPTEPTVPPTEPSEPTVPPTEPSEPTEPTVPPTEPEEPAEPVDLTVKKVWKGDEKIVKDHPDSVKITLFNGKEAVETVVLGDWNAWQYTWKDLSPDGDWSVIEVHVPGGYTPSYKVSGEVVTITNTATLIQTGQLNWPIPVLGGLGVLMIFFGIFTMRKKRKTENA